MIDNLISHLKEMRSGWKATRLIMLLRWRLIRVRKTRLFIYMSAIFVSIGVLSSMNIGYAIELSVRQPNASQSVQLQTMISYLLHALEGNIGALLLISIFATAFFSPIIGSTIVSLFPSDDLQSIRPNVTHRFFDSLIINCVSGIGLLQMLALLGLTSIVTIDGQGFIPLLMAWALWFCFIGLMTTIGWSDEYILRRVGRFKRNLVGLGVGLTFASTFLFAFYFEVSPLALGEFYIREIRRISETGWTSEIPSILSIFLLIFITLLIIGTAITKKALLLPAPVDAISSWHRKSKLTTNNTRLTLRLLFQIIWRTNECKNPIQAILLFGVPAMLLISNPTNIKIILTLAVPLTIALAWGVNTFGILGTGTNWLIAQPKIMKRMPFYSALVQIIISFSLMITLWLVSFLSGGSNLDDGISLLATGIFSVIGASLLGCYLSIYRPVRTQLTSRGNALVPPLTALNYIIKLVLVTSIPSIIFYLTVSPVAQFRALNILTVLYLTGFYVLVKKWEGAETRARVVQIVSVP